MGSLNHMCHYFQNIIPVNYSIWQMGVIIVIMKRELVSSVCRIQSVVPHLPAKALLLNIKQYNGKFGCITCKHPGRYSHSARQIRARLYEYWPSGTVAVREAHETRMFGRIGEVRGTIVFGIKRENVFCQLVDISDNLPID